MIDFCIYKLGRKRFSHRCRVIEAIETVCARTVVRVRRKYVRVHEREDIADNRVFHPKVFLKSSALDVICHV